MYKLSIFILLFIIFFAGCSQKIPTVKPTAAKTTNETILRDSVAKSALKYLNRSDGKDCSGFVSLINRENGEVYYSSDALNEFFDDHRRSLAIYNLLKERGRIYVDEDPKVADLIFFANTIKLKGKKESVENITHIGIVSDVHNDGTIEFIHHLGDKNVIGSVNLKQPDVIIEDGKMLNSFIKRCGSNTDKTKCLTSYHFSAFGRIKID